MLAKQYLIDFARKNYDNAPENCKLALASRYDHTTDGVKRFVDFDNQETHVLQYFYDWYHKS